MQLIFSLLLVTSIITTHNLAQAQVRSDLVTDGVTYETLKCPASNENIKQFRQKLIDLKNNIKKEAHCEPIETKIDGISKLIVDDRKDILTLIDKGQAEGLNSDEQGKVEDYVQNITEQTGALLTILAGKDACFDEDKQRNTMGFLTSLISEGSRILSLVAGPEIGGTIEVAGEVISGFLKGMDTLNKNKRGYKFAQADQRIAYSDSLCALFEYQRELDVLLAPYDSMGRLENLQFAIDEQLQILQTKCPECANMIYQVEDKKSILLEVKNEDEITMNDVWDMEFEKKIADQAKAIDRLYTKRLGTHTYKALKTSLWIPLRLKSLENNILVADLDLEETVSQMDSLEKFMVVEQAPSFIEQLIVEARGWNKNVSNHLSSAPYTIYNLIQKNKDLKLDFVPQLLPDEAYYGEIFEFLVSARTKVNSSDRASINTFFRTLKKKSRNMNIAVSVVDNYCLFFEKAEWYNFGIEESCNQNSLKQLREQSEIFLNYELLIAMTETPNVGSSPDSGTEESEPVVVESEASNSSVVVAADPIESLTFQIEDITKNTDYVTRRAPRAIRANP